jgi:transcriptional regulator
MKEKSDLLRGTLDLMILRTLGSGPLHGVAVADRIREASGGLFDVRPGSLFPALHRLERQGWIEGEWALSPEGRRVRAYHLTSAGRRQASSGKRAWERAARAMAEVIG